MGNGSTYPAVFQAEHRIREVRETDVCRALLLHFLCSSLDYKNTVHSIQQNPGERLRAVELENLIVVNEGTLGLLPEGNEKVLCAAWIKRLKAALEPKAKSIYRRRLSVPYTDKASAAQVILATFYSQDAREFRGFKYEVLWIRV